VVEASISILRGSRHINASPYKSAAGLHDWETRSAATPGDTSYHCVAAASEKTNCSIRERRHIPENRAPRKAGNQEFLLRFEQRAGFRDTAF
jgi:hypothetical protein